MKIKAVLAVLALLSLTGTGAVEAKSIQIGTTTIPCSLCNPPRFEVDRPPSPEKIGYRHGLIVASTPSYSPERASTAAATLGDLYELAVGFTESNKILRERIKALEYKDAHPFCQSVQISTAMMAQLPEFLEMKQKIKDLEDRPCVSIYPYEVIVGTRTYRYFDPRWKK